jgi:hypothetical protein
MRLALVVVMVCADAAAAPRAPGWHAMVHDATGLNVRADSTGAITIDDAGMTLRGRLTDPERARLALVLADPSLPATLERAGPGADTIFVHRWTESTGSQDSGTCGRAAACARLVVELRAAARRRQAPTGAFRSLGYGGVELGADGTLVEGHRTARLPADELAGVVTFFTSSATWGALTAHCVHFLAVDPERTLPLTIAVGDDTLTVDLLGCPAKRDVARAQLRALCGRGRCRPP